MSELRKRAEPGADCGWVADDRKTLCIGGKIVNAWSQKLGTCPRCEGTGRVECTEPKLERRELPAQVRKES